MVYLDNAATSWKKPPMVYKEIIRCMQRYGANPGRSGHKMAIAASEKILECRENICKLFNIDNCLCVCFTSNATEALNIGIKGLLNPGDHAITTSMEHNSVLRPIMHLKDKGVEFSVVKADKSGYVNPEDIEKLIKNNTKLIITIHASNVIGTLLPIKEIGNIAKMHNIIYMVDAAQTAGVYPIDVEKMNIDMLAFPGHKGLLGPQGTGGLYIRDGINLNTIKEGGTGSESQNPYQPEIIPDKYESGTLNTPGIAGLCEGVKFILNMGVDNILKHERKLTKYLVNGLSSINKVKIYGSKNMEERVGVVSFNIENMDCMDVCKILDSHYDIASRGGLHCAYLAHETLGTLKIGTVRFSIGCFNTKNDIDYVLDAVNEIAKKI